MALIDKLFKSRKTILDMVNERGHTTTGFHNYSLNEIEIMYSNHSKNSKDISPLDITINSSNTLFIKYMLTPRIRISNIQTVIDAIIENYSENDTIILIIKDKISSESVLEDYFEKIYKQTKIFIQCFYLDTLTFNVSKHNMVPKHEILSKEDTTKLVNGLHILSINKLPKIKKTDPIAKYHGMKINDVCRISRTSETTGVYYYYRLCE
tara:strand:- start:1311 stop:1937 length:627 start_codon:yes stop_codon:yes gene_type:complete